MDKRAQLLLSAQSIFAKKGYKKTNISDIAKLAGMAVGSFYKFYDSKEDIFLEVYKLENARLRQSVIEEVNWKASAELMIEEIFDVTNALCFQNKIMAEWQNPQVSGILHQYYLSEKGLADNQFHQFLIKLLPDKMKELGIDEELSDRLIKVYELIYYIYCKMSIADFKEYENTMKTLLKYFVKGVMADEGIF